MAILTRRWNSPHLADPHEQGDHELRCRAPGSHRATQLAPILVLAASVVLRISNPPFLDEMQLQVFDLLQRLHPRAYQALPVRIIDIDETTLARYGQRPWPRTQVAALIAQLARLGARPIVLDILFAEPDRTSPAQILPLWPPLPALIALRSQINALPDHDHILAQQVSLADVVTAFALIPQANAVTSAPLLKAGFAYAGPDPKARIPVLHGAVVSLAPLQDAAKGNGHFTLLTERDGVTRRVPLLLRLDEWLYPALSAEAVRVAQGASTYVIKSTGGSGELGTGGRPEMVSVKIGSRIVPTDAQGQMWVYATPTVPERTIPARCSQAWSRRMP